MGFLGTDCIAGVGVRVVVYLQLWRYEGQNTLAYYLRRRDTLRALARDLDVPEDIVVPVAMRQMLLGLAALHSAGLVHRCGPACSGGGHGNLRTGQLGVGLV